MKLRANTYKKLAVVLLPLFAAGLSTLMAAPPVATPTTKPEIPKSNFVLPANSNEGRDPFFPDSTRVYEQQEVKQHANDSPVTALQVKSIMGAAPRFFAIIGTKDYSGGAHTFGVGEDGEVIYKDGRRVAVRCIKITPTSVLLEADGQPIPLTYSPGP
jgi:hypothetical protein